MGSLEFQARESLEILEICKQNLMGYSIGSEDEQNPGRTTGSGDCVHEVSEGNKRTMNFTTGLCSVLAKDFAAFYLSSKNSSEVVFSFL